MTNWQTLESFYYILAMVYAQHIFNRAAYFFSMLAC